MARPRRIEPGFKVLTQDALATDDPDDSYWGTGRVFVKPQHRDKPMRVGYEFLAARLAAAIGLPVPAGEISEDIGARKAWVSAVIDYQGQEFAPERPEQAVTRQPDIAAGIFVFDVWVLNADRNEENLISHEKLGMWIIDHELAFGAVQLESPELLPLLSDRELRFHVFRDLPLDEKYLREWGERIHAVPATVIKRTVTEGFLRGLYAAPVRDSLITFLLHRQNEVHRLVEQSRPAPPHQPDAAAGKGLTGGVTEEEPG
jgi:hypothetical protein